MPEVYARFEQLLHGDVSQLTSSFGLHPALTLRLPRIAIPVPAPRGTGRIEHLRIRRSSLVVSRQPTAVADDQRRRTNDRIYRLLYWNRFLAPFWPYFFRSLPRESRVTMPSALSFLRISTLNIMSARAMPSFTASAWPFTPPPETRATTLKVLAVSVESNGCFAAERCAGVTKYSSKARPLILNSPLPGRR